MTTLRTSSLARLQTSSLREEAKRSIRSGMLSGEIVAGEIYSAPSLAERLGVSATPVREALLDLANDGLVEPVRNRGFRLVVLTDDDLQQIYELRALLEIPAVLQVVGKLSAERIAHLYGLAEDLERAAANSDLASYLAADHEFHATLVEPVGNDRLTELVGRLGDQLRLCGFARGRRSEPVMRTAAEHRAILDAVVSGDSATAEELIRSHLTHTREGAAERLHALDGHA